MTYLSRIATTDYILKHGIEMPNEQVVLFEPLFVYKKVDMVHKCSWGHTQYEPVLANLIIPAGSFVNLPQSEECKLRANRAICWNIVDYDHKNKPVHKAIPHHSSYRYANTTYKSLEFYLKKEGFSKTDIKAAFEELLVRVSDPKTKYKKSSLVLPEWWDDSTTECAQGIHFFVEKNRAIAW